MVYQVLPITNCVNVVFYMVQPMVMTTPPMWFSSHFQGVQTLECRRNISKSSIKDSVGRNPTADFFSKILNAIF